MICLRLSSRFFPRLRRGGLIRPALYLAKVGLSLLRDCERLETSAQTRGLDEKQ